MIKIAIIGYGNLGKACERIAYESADFQVTGIFTRRDPKSLVSPYSTQFFPQDEIEMYKDAVDVACICTGSANDVTDLGVKLAKNFNTVDSFDTHAKMRMYFETMDKTATEYGNLCFVGIGWDPGLFSLMRVLCQGVLPSGNTQTFWGRGVSQGHSEAIRRIDGVEDAKQYTVPKSTALALAMEGNGECLGERDKHFRECYVVTKEGADLAKIEREIVTMPNYFEPYDTAVHFISKDEFEKNHATMPHAGIVMRVGDINGTAHRMEFALKLDSNPDFTASVLMSYARANALLAGKGEIGARSILDIPVSALLGGNRADMVQKFV